MSGSRISGVRAAPLPPAAPPRGRHPCISTPGRQRRRRGAGQSAAPGAPGRSRARRLLRGPRPSSSPPGVPSGLDGRVRRAARRVGLGAHAPVSRPCLRDLRPGLRARSRAKALRSPRRRRRPAPKSPCRRAPSLAPRRGATHPGQSLPCSCSANSRPSADSRFRSKVRKAQPGEEASAEKGSVGAPPAAHAPARQVSNPPGFSVPSPHLSSLSRALYSETFLPPHFPYCLLFVPRSFFSSFAPWAKSPPPAFPLHPCPRGSLTDPAPLEGLPLPQHLGALLFQLQPHTSQKGAASPTPAPLVTLDHRTPPVLAPEEG